MSCEGQFTLCVPPQRVFVCLSGAPPPPLPGARHVHRSCSFAHSQAIKSAAVHAKELFAGKPHDKNEKAVPAPVVGADHKSGGVHF